MYKFNSLSVKDILDLELTLLSILLLVLLLVLLLKQKKYLDKQ